MKRSQTRLAGPSIAILFIVTQTAGTAPAATLRISETDCQTIASVNPATEDHSLLSSTTLEGFARYLRGLKAEEKGLCPDSEGEDE